MSSAYHPQTNGLDERTNQTLKNKISRLVNDQQNNWDEHLEAIAYSMRTQKQASTKFSPFFLMYNRHPNSLVEVSGLNYYILTWQEL